MFNCENVCGNKRKTEDLPFQGVSCFNCKPEVMYLISIFFSLLNRSSICVNLIYSNYISFSYRFDTI